MTIALCIVVAVVFAVLWVLVNLALAELWLRRSHRRRRANCHCVLTDRDADPTERCPLPPGQVWVWLSGPGRPHWAIMGTGAILDD